MKRLRKNKRAMEFSSFFFAIMAIGVVVLAIAAISGSLEKTYNTHLPFGLEDLNKLEDMEQINTQQVQGLEIKETVSGEDFRGVIIKGVTGILNTIFIPLTTVFGKNGLVAIVSDKFGVPYYIQYFLYVLLISMIIFSLMRIFIKSGHKI